jgi:VanZ family protein
MKSAALLSIAAMVAITLAINLRLAPWIMTVVRQVPGRDMTGHVVLFGVVSLLVNLAFARSRVWGRELGVPLCTALLLVGIALEEYSQKWVPNRDFSMSDLGASYAGTLVAALVAWIILSRSEAKARPTETP